MVRFTLFGIPVEIQPWFWLTIALLSRALTSSNLIELQFSLIFILAATVSILVHELGHAVSGRRLGGGYARIVLWAFGGLAYNEGGRFTKSGRFWMIAAGPGAGFVLGGLVFLIMAVIFGPTDSAKLAGGFLFNLDAKVSPETYEFVQSRRPLIKLFDSMLWINFWWGVINLLPIPPLDGGQIAELFVKPRKLLHQIAIAAAVATAGFGLWMGSLYMLLLFGYLAWQNYQSMQSLYRR